MTITEFLEARIAEDEAVAVEPVTDQWSAWALEGGEDVAVSEFASGSDDRALAECAAKRQLLRDFDSPELLNVLASIYASHPEYRQEWA
jgi:hypothetical protein